MDGVEVVDGQIHEPPTPAGWEAILAEQAIAAKVELAREAMDAVGVDGALVVAGDPFILGCVTRYPDRFRGVVTFVDPSTDDRVAAARAAARPEIVAGRALIADFRDASLKPSFAAGEFDALFAAADEARLPMFVSTHGHAGALAPIAERHPELTLIVDHLGLSQSPVSPPRADPWDALPDLIALARYPNVHVKLCGLPVLSREAYPFADTRPYLTQVIDAFTPDRLMWASDYTRLRLARVTAGWLGRERGRLFSEARDQLLYDDRLDGAAKRSIMGGTLRRVLGWPNKTMAQDQEGNGR